MSVSQDWTRGREELEAENAYLRSLQVKEKKRQKTQQTIIIGLTVVLVAAIALLLVIMLPRAAEKEPEKAVGDGDRVLGWSHAFPLETEKPVVIPDPVPVTPPESKPVVDAETPDWVTKDYLTISPYSRPGYLLEAQDTIVVHYVGNPNTSAKANRNYFNSLADGNGGSYSAHFVIGLKGEVIQCMPLNEVAWHASDANYYSIGIECCHPDETGKFNDATMESLIKLIQWLIDTYDIKSGHVIRHYEVKGKECPRYYVKNPSEWLAIIDSLTFPD